MSPHVPITDLVNELCGRFYVEPANVARVVIDPHAVTLDIYKLNDEGRKYTVDADGQPCAGRYRRMGEADSSKPAMERLVIAVKT